jgi:hypothetical protein
LPSFAKERKKLSREGRKGKSKIETERDALMSDGFVLFYFILFSFVLLRVLRVLRGESF